MELRIRAPTKQPSRLPKASQVLMALTALTVCPTVQALLNFHAALGKLLPLSQSPLLPGASGVTQKKGGVRHAWLREGGEEGGGGRSGEKSLLTIASKRSIPSFSPFEFSVSFCHLLITVCHLICSLWPRASAY